MLRAVSLPASAFMQIQQDMMYCCHASFAIGIDQYDADANGAALQLLLQT